MVNLSDVSISIIVLGGFLTILGLLASVSSIIILGLSLIPIGILIAWGEGDHEEVYRRLYNSWDNVTLLLEELNAVSNAIYMPSSNIEGGDSVAFVSITPTSEPPPMKLPLKFSVRYGSARAGLGILLYTPGSMVVKLCKEGNALGGNVDEALNSCLVNYLSIADKVNVRSTGKEYVVEVINPKLNHMYENTIVEKVLGSPIASAVAGVIAETLGEPVMISGEEVRGKRRMINLTVIEGY